MLVVATPFAPQRNLVIDPRAEARMDAARVDRDDDGEVGFYYNQALEARNIDRRDDRYRHAFEYAMMWLLDNRPFYSHLFYDVVRRRTHKIETLCVLIINARIELWYNPDFLALHTLRHNVGFLQHEAGHLISGHLAEKKRLRGQIPVYMDVATDLSVDSLIQADGDQPDWVLLPSDLRVPTPDLAEDKWPRAEEQQGWQYYQRLLTSGDPLAQFLEKLRMRPVPDGKRLMELGIGDGSASSDTIKVHLTSFDDHSHWEKGDPPDVQDQIVTSTVKKAWAKSGGNIGGYIHGNMVKAIEMRLKEKSVPFERILRGFVGGHLKIGHKATPMRPSRRRHIPPGRTFARGLDILCAGDDSGSMSDEEVALCRSELHNLTMQSGVRVRFQRFCCGLVGDLLDLDQTDFSKVAERASGGTDFNAVIDLAHELKPDLLLIMTDGGASTPERRPPCPLAWILTHDGTSHPWGTIIRMPTIEDIRRGYRAVIERWAPK